MQPSRSDAGHLQGCPWGRFGSQMCQNPGTPTPHTPGGPRGWCSLPPVSPQARPLGASKGRAQQTHLHPRVT